MVLPILLPPWYSKWNRIGRILTNFNVLRKESVMKSVTERKMRVILGAILQDNNPAELGGNGAGYNEVIGESDLMSFSEFFLDFIREEKAVTRNGIEKGLRDYLLKYHSTDEVENKTKFQELISNFDVTFDVLFGAGLVGITTLETVDFFLELGTDGEDGSELWYYDRSSTNVF